MLSADSSHMCMAFSDHLQGSCTAEEVRGQVWPYTLLGNGSPVKKVGPKGLRSGPVGLGVLSDSDESWAVQEYPLGGSLAVLLARLTV